MTSNLSIIEQIRRIKDPETRYEALRNIESRDLSNDWDLLRRGDQTPPSDTLWNLWIYSGGRGAGKTRMGAEEVVKFATNNPNSRLLVVGPSSEHLRSVLVEGESGIIAASRRRRLDYTYSPAVRRFTWGNKSQAFLAIAEEPDSIRGIQSHFTWADAIESWPVSKDPFELTAWDALQYATRLGDHPRTIATVTPIKNKSVKRLHKALKRNPLTVRLTQASTYSNSHLDGRFVSMMVGQYGNTGLAATELKGLWPWKI